MKLLRELWVLLRKDLLIELRGREVISTTVLFVVLTVVVFGLGVIVPGQERARMAPGGWWVCLAFAGVLSTGRSFAAEREGGCLPGLLLAPVSREALLLSKVVANFVFLTGCAVIAVPLVGATFCPPLLGELPRLIPVVLLGVLGHSVVGTLVAALVLNSRLQELLLPVVSLPLVLPVVIFGTRATGALVSTELAGSFGLWIRFLAVFDVVALVAGLLTFEFLVEDRS